MDRQKHWDDVYESKPDDKLSWFQPEPDVSVSLVRSLPIPPRRVIDIGGGQSVFVKTLLEQSPVQAAILDISIHAIERARARYGAVSSQVRWIVADILASEDLGPVDLWHDRAVFHFLTQPEERRQYAKIASRAVVPGGHAIIATFATTGPDKCSGLPVCRFDAQSLAEEFAPSFQLTASATESHATPWHSIQEFTYAVLAKQ